jgi:hypothetical protein
VGTSTDILRSLRHARPLSSPATVKGQDETEGASISVVDALVHAGNGRTVVSPLKTISYRASGGDSERRTYADDEGVTIESQDGGYVLAWSAQAQAPDFLKIVSQLVDTSVEVQLSLPADEKAAPGVERQITTSLSTALTVIADHPEIEAIEVTAVDETFGWTANDPYAHQRHELTRVILAFSVLDPTQLVRLLTETGAPHIKDDLAGIAASVVHLTDTTTTSSAVA